MSKKRHKQKRQGHFCWSCGCVRPNEKFSGKGHARHLCRDCAKLGAKELAYRQALRNLERCLTWEGIIPRKRRQQFRQFLKHEDPRIREVALEMQEEDAANRLWLYEEEALLEQERGGEFLTLADLERSHDWFDDGESPPDEIDHEKEIPF